MRIQRQIPGAVLCVAIGLAARVLELAQRTAAGRVWLEALVVALLLGTAIRWLWTPGDLWNPGIDFAARPVLEAAVVLLGLSVDLPLLVRAGPALALGIVLVVVLGLASSFTIARRLGLNRHLSLLIACGNSICGNSAIAAVAPTIGAAADDIGAAIAFTAALGVAVVLGLPIAGHALGYTPFQFGVLAGLCVYAVPQVLAATLAFDPLSAQVGTLVKLVRVLMLGPVVITLAVFERRRGTATAAIQPKLPPLHALVPWFVLGFLVCVALRFAGVVNAEQALVARELASALTIVAMAALGLGVSVRTLARQGRSVLAAVTLSLVVLVLISIALIAGLGVR